MSIPAVAWLSVASTGPTFICESDPHGGPVRWVLFLHPPTGDETEGQNVSQLTAAR